MCTPYYDAHKLVHPTISSQHKRGILNLFHKDGEQVKLSGHEAMLNFDEAGNFECKVDISGFEAGELTVYIEKEDINIVGQHKCDNECDLVFFHRLPKQTDDFEQAIMSSSLINDNIYHVAMAISEDKIVHATVEPGVKIEFLADAINDLKPDLVELTTINLESEWKEKASLWAQEQVGAEYNDIFSHKLINSRGKKSFYCCQLVEEAYKAASLTELKNPFLPHKLNFLDGDGKMIPYWIDYYKRLCPENPTVPQGEPGSHASILRASPVVELVASRAFVFGDEAEKNE